ncbi:MAG: RNA methyltransferase [Cyclobacteriaceae bacterium]|nr:RNA methyltransferase [Cyclobacteriaceae bacterium]
MISKAKVKHLKSLQVKKYRKQEQSFLVEGAKSVVELLNSDFEVLWLAGTRLFLNQNEETLSGIDAEIVEATDNELALSGSFQSNDGALAVAKMKVNTEAPIKNEFVLVLDDIRDPGNLGTIIRTADWYGIKKIVASEETADFYNPKVLNASMGSFCRVSMYYTQLVTFLNKSNLPIYGTFLGGTDVHKVKFDNGGLIVIGNESNGISLAVEKLIAHKITIPRFGNAESLNAAIATGVILDVVRQSKK